MENQRPSIDSVFFAALEKETPEKLKEYLDEVCGDDAEFRARVEKLLSAHYKAAASFLEKPPSVLAQVVEANKDAIEAGLAATFGPQTAAVIGSAGHSVLKSLSKSVPNVPQVTLADSHQDRDSVVQPGSDEVPQSEADDRYQLLGEIARGGMGAIIKGRDTDLGRDLAVKVLLDSHKQKPELIQRFVEEAQIGGQLQHPGIVPIYELGQFGDQRPFFTMKLVKGQTLASILSDRQSPQEELPRLLGIFEQVCQAMGYAHSKGVIHRDLKPANIMVGAFGEVQVMDWGLSKVLKTGGVADEKKSIDKHRDVSVVETRRSAGSDVPGSGGSDTMDGSVMGTPAYMPPEQAHGEIDRLVQRADVFGLGAILAEILTGKPPYVAESDLDLLRMARRGKLDNCFKRLDTSGAEDELLALCKKSLATEPVDRFKDAEQLSAEVTRYLEGVQERLKQTELARVEAQARSEEERRRKKLYFAIAGLMSAAAVGSVLGVISLQKQNRRIQAQKTEIENKSAEIEIQKTKLKEKNSQITKERDQALLQASRANAMRLTTEAQAIRTVSRRKSLIVSAEAAEFSRGLGADLERAAHADLLESSATVGGTPLGEDFIGDVWRGNMAQFSLDRRWLVVGNALFDLQGTAAPWSSPVELHEDWVESVAIDAGSRWLANGGTRRGEDRGLIHLFDLKNGAIDGPSLTLFDDSAPAVSVLAISADGRWLASKSGRSGKLVRLWDLGNLDAKTPFQTLEQSETITRLEFSPTIPDCLAVGCQNKETETLTTSVWKFMDSEFKSVRELPGARTTFCPNGEWLLTATVDEVYVWKIQAGAFADEPVLIKSRRSLYDSAPVITPDGNRIVTMSVSEGGKIWSLREPDSPPVSLIGTAKGRLLVSPDSHSLVGSTGDSFLVWDLTSQEMTLMPQEYECDAKVTAIGRDNRWLLTGRRRWDLKSMQTVRSPTSIQTRASMHLTGFSDEGSRLNTLQPDPDSQPFFQQFEFSPVETKTTLEFSLGEGTSCAAMSDNQHWLVVGKKDGNVDLYDLRKSSTGVPIPLQLDHDDAICQVGISNEDAREGQLLLTASKDRTVRLTLLEHATHDIVSSTVIADDHENFYSEEGLSPPSISPNKRWLFVKKPENDSDGATLFHLNDQFELVDSFRIPADKMFWDVVFSPDCHWAVTRPNSRAHLPQVNWMWDLTSDDPSANPFPLKGRVAWSFHTAAAFSPNNSMLAIGEYMGRASLWDLKADNPSATHTILKASAHVASVAFSPDNKWIATGSFDGTIRLWCMEDEDPTANPMVLVGATNQIYRLQFHPHLPILVSHSDKPGKIRLWNYDVESAVQGARRLAGRTLSPNERDSLGLANE